MTKKAKPQITHQLTLDEYDELTAEHQKKGAEWERQAIIAHLHNVQSQILGIKNLTSKVELKNELMDTYDGIDVAIGAINILPDLYSRDFCTECGAS